MSFIRKLFALTLVAGLILQSPVEAATYYFRYTGTQAQPSGSPPSSPAPAGTFAILVDTPTPDVAVIGDIYSATTYAYSNVGPVVFSIVSGALPSGISINPTTGTIFGSPTTVETSSIVIQGVDTTTGQTATASISMDTIDAFSITGNPGAVVTVNTPYSATFSLSGGSEPYGFSIGAVPPGLAFTASATSAGLAGSPSVPGVYPIAVVGTEAHGLTVQYPYTLTVADLLAISGSAPASGTVGTPYSGQLTVTGGAAPLSYSLAAGTLPAGLTLKPTTGIISGTPVSPGTKTSIRVKVVDASGQSAISAPFSIVITASGAQNIAISGTLTPNGTENVAYSSQFTAGGGSGGYVYTLASGTLPSGLSLNPSTGIVSGTPAFGTAGVYGGLAVKVTDSALHVATSAAFTLSIAPGAVPLAISGSPSSSVQQGANYAAKFTGTGGSGVGYSYAVAAGELPPGLTLKASTGLVSGTATTVGTYPGIVIRVTDSAGHTASTAPFAIAVGAPPPLVISGSATPSVNEGASYSSTWTAFDGSGSGYHFTSVGGALPPGLSLSDVNGARGLLSGTATVAGVYSGLQIQVQDSDGNTALSNVFSIMVVPTATPGNALTISGSPGNGDLGAPYSAQFVASGGSNGGYVYAVTAGTLPPGVALDALTGALTGTPTMAGAYSGIVVSVTDGAGSSAATAPFSIAVLDSNSLTISWSPQTNWQVGDFVAEAPTASGGDTSNYVFSVNGTLPPGLSLLSSGVLFGSLDTPGTFGPFSITVSDGVRSATTSPPTTFVVAAPGLFVSGFPASIATEGQAYSAQFEAQGGSGSGYVFSMNGTLPAGLSIDPSTGLISGSPSAGSAGTYANLSVHVVDGIGTTADSPAFSITVSVSTPLSVSGSPAPNTTIGSTYNAQFLASGGSGSGYVYSMVGTLPAGLSLNSNSGLISGTPSLAGSYSGLAVQVADPSGATALSASFSITVSSGTATPLSISGAPATSAIVGAPYSAQFVAAGGAGGYVYSVVGALPPGLVLNGSTGALTGTPTTKGVYPNLQVVVIDAASATTSSQVFSITVASALAIAGSPSATAVVGSSYSAEFTASGGAGGYVYSMSGALPPGLSLNPSTGLLSGVPTKVGIYSGLSVTVTDATSATASTAAFSISLSTSDALVISGMPETSAWVGIGYNVQFTASGGSGSGYLFGYTGALPPGITLDTITGFLSGTPAAGSNGNYPNLSITLTDSAGNLVGTGLFAINVHASVAPIAVAGAPATTATIGTAYSAQFSASGGTGGYAFSIAAGSLPAGLIINPNTGLLSGVPATGSAGAYAGIVVRAVDKNGNEGNSAAFTLTVGDPGSGSPPTPTGVAIASGQVGYSYSSSTFSYSGTTGVPPYSYVLATGALPPGINMNATSGVLSGVPTAAGTYSFSVKLIDSVATSSLAGPVSTITISAGSVMAWSGTSVPSINATISNGVDSSSGSYMRFTGGVEPFTFTVTGGPAGLGVLGTTRSQFKIGGKPMVVGFAGGRGAKTYPSVQLVVTGADGAVLKTTAISLSLSTASNDQTGATNCYTSYLGKPGMTAPGMGGTSSNCFSSWTNAITANSGYVEIDYQYPVLIKQKVGAIGATSGGGTISAWYWDEVGSWVALGTGTQSLPMAGLYARSFLFKVTDGIVTSTKWGAY